MKKHQFMVAALTFCCLTFIGIPAARAMDGQIKIGRPADGESYPIVIDHAGSYVLTDNLVVGDPDVDAIRIEINDVTLDLNGHTIHGPASGGNGNGIWAENRYSISVLNGRVWGFGGHGIYLLSTSGHPSEKNAGHILLNMQVLNNYASGISIDGGTVSNCVANGNGAYGIAASYSTVNNCTANKNSATIYLSSGIYLTHATAANCTANLNSDFGIEARDSTISNMTTNENGQDGITAYRSSVAGCTASGNTHAGISAYGYTRLENNLVCGNHEYGLIITSTANFAIKNTGGGNTPVNMPTVPAGNFVPLTGDNANVFF